jgi:ribosome modulation factor
MRRREVEVMFSDTQWDHEVDVVCLGAEGGVLAAGLVATNEDLDVYLGITESAGGGDLAASLTYRGGDGQTTKHLAGFDYAFGGVGRAQSFCPVRASKARGFAAGPCGTSRELAPMTTTLR